jgi:hypothetical protein
MVSLIDGERVGQMRLFDDHDGTFLKSIFGYNVEPARTTKLGVFSRNLAAR